jgi:hypothetical protein
VPPEACTALAHRNALGQARTPINGLTDIQKKENSGFCGLSACRVLVGAGSSSVGHHSMAQQEMERWWSDSLALWSRSILLLNDQTSITFNGNKLCIININAETRTPNENQNQTGQAPQSVYARFAQVLKL